MAERAQVTEPPQPQASPAPPAHTPAGPQSWQGILGLQQSAGNGAVARAITAPPLDAGPPTPLRLVPTQGPTDGEPNPDLLAETARQVDLVDAAANDAIAQIDAALAEHLGAVTQVFAAQQAQVDESHAAHTAAVAASTEAHQAEVTSRATSARQDVGSAADQAHTATSERANAMAAEVDNHATQQASKAQTEANDRVAAAKPAVAASDPDVAHEQEKVSDAVSGKARTEITGSATRTADQVRDHATKMRNEVFGPTDANSRQQIADFARDSDRAVADGAGVATNEIANLGTMAAHTAQDAHQTVTSGIAAGKDMAQRDLTSWAEEGKERIRGTANNLRAQLDQQGRALASAGLPSQVAAISTAGSEVVAAINDTAQSVLGGLGEMADAQGQAVSGVGAQAAQGFTAASTAAATATQQASTAFSQHAQQTTTAATSDLAQAPQRTTDALAPHKEKGMADMAGTVDEAGQNQQDWAAQTRGKGEEGTAKLESEAQGMDSNISVQRLFDSAIASMRSWLKDKLGDIAGGIVSGLILSIPALLIAGGLLLAGPVGWGVLAALLVVGIGFGIYSRFTEYAADHDGHGPGWGDGTLLVLLGIADITGIPYIVEAAVGQRAFAPRPMTTFERWERGTQGVVNLALVVAGGAKKLFGTTEPHPNVPVDPHAPAVDPNVDPHGPAVDPDPGPARPRDCFVPGTLVATPAGGVPIEQLAVGDVVWTIDPETKKTSTHPVTAALRRSVPVVLDISLGAVSVSVSPEHPFWVAGAGWQRAGDLRPGTSLLSATGEMAVVSVEQRPGPAHTVHNLTVSGSHTYLVSEAQLLVHNKGAAYDPVAALRTTVEELATRLRQALRSAEAQPDGTAGKADRVAKLRNLQKSIDQLRTESNGPDPDVDDLSDWANSLDKQLEPIEKELPEPTPEPEHASEPLTDEGAFEALQRRRLWADITRANPDRTWDAHLAEDMTSNVAGQTKHKLVVTGRKAGAPPVEVEISVIYDRTTGTFEDMHLSSGRSVRQ